MCHAARCRTCGKVTWRGCGMHVATVRASVPADRWCDGHPDVERTAGIIQRWLRR
jgi:hypothetical protein